MERNCFICGKPYSGGREFTCSDKCHERFVEKIIKEFGEFKKVVRMSTGEAFKVPTRDIIEKGIREQDLDQYPRWEEASEPKQTKRSLNMKSTVSVKSEQLNKEDVRALLQAIRDCEMAKFPNKEIRVLVEVPELPIDEMKGILTSIKPPYKYGPFTFGIKKKEEP